MFQIILVNQNFLFVLCNCKPANVILNEIKMLSNILLVESFVTFFSHGYAFYTAALVGGELLQLHSNIEDMVAQADEIADQYLSFEGGLHTSAIIVDSSYKLATAAKKAPTITEAS